MKAAQSPVPVMDVVLCWHMHQPDYRLAGVYLKPWTWLHAIKDYTDMAAHLESVPGARAVVNFSAVLIEQLQDYPRRISGHLENDQPIGDLILDALGAEVPAGEERLALIEALLRVNEPRMKPRFEPYSRLFDRAKIALSDGGSLDESDLADLLVWYVIVWLGESLREGRFISQLMAKGSGYTIDDRRALLRYLGETIGEILPRYRRLAEGRSVELSLTPYAHPILPLLLDIDSAREAMPHAPLPSAAYPGGLERCRWHIEQGQRVFAGAFGERAEGCWPSEGAVSEETIHLLDQAGFSWLASGNKVLINSLGETSSQYGAAPHLDPWQIPESRASCFFRDDELSDLIGFEYSKWNARDAVRHLIDRMLQRRADFVASQGQGRRPVLSIIVDGENAWEYFEENAREFVRELYTQIAANPELKLTTFSDVVKHGQAQELGSLCAGSWVYGTLSTWVGDPAKNRAWELLSAAKAAVDAALEPCADSELPESVESIYRQLAVCEASDWFWWLGDDNSLQDGPVFDALFRKQLSRLYALIGMNPPSILDQPIGGNTEQHLQAGAEGAGAMRRSS